MSDYWIIAAAFVMGWLLRPYGDALLAAATSIVRNANAKRKQ